MSWSGWRHPLHSLGFGGSSNDLILPLGAPLVTTQVGSRTEPRGLGASPLPLLSPACAEASLAGLEELLCLEI